MNKYYIKVPKGIQYMSEWKEYVLPQGHCIVDKGVTGCGYTEYCLMNNQNIVLCSPRKLLLENKRDQHISDLNILYLENNIENFQGVNSIENKIKDHIFNCQGPFNNLPCKLMVTYDSSKYVVDLLKKNNLLNEFTFVVDEFQSIFRDSHFKSEVELGFVEVLQDCPNVLYLSATPMLERYLDRLPEFKDLNFYHLDWSETGFVDNIIIRRKNVNYLTSACSEIIQNYLSGKFPISLNENGQPVESREVVFYMNSVSDIIRVINKNNLTPYNTRIICSDQDNNRIKLKRIGFQIGKVPLKDEQNPMFMFCTSTSYMGVDFYSKCASTVVFADPNIKTLNLDISLDLPQIVGRQRDKSNPFKNNIIIFYKTQKKPITKEEFDRIQNERKSSTKIILDGFEKLSQEEKSQYLKKIKDSIRVSQYSDDFVSISKNTNLPVYNSFIEIANERAWEVSQKDYQDRISVTRALDSIGYINELYVTESDSIIQDFLDNYFYKTGLFSEKMKLYCEFRDSYSNDQKLTQSLDFKIKDSKFKAYYEYYGTKGCKAKEYREIELYKGFKDITLSEKLEERIHSIFRIGDKYQVSVLKKMIQEIYNELGISGKAKATDLGKYFKLIKTRITLPDKTVVNGFKLESL